jgi:hypothetical protein
VIVTERHCNSSANKSNHPIQNPLLFVTEPLHVTAIRSGLDTGCLFIVRLPVIEDSDKVWLELPEKFG